MPTEVEGEDDATTPELKRPKPAPKRNSLRPAIDASYHPGGLANTALPRFIPTRRHGSEGQATDGGGLQDNNEARGKSSNPVLVPSTDLP